MFKRVLIANRGVIATRVLEACKELGIEAVTVYTPDDKDSLHVTESERAIAIRKYNEAAEIISVADHVKADAIHPGVGFLSENPDFAFMARNYATFIGPSLEVIRGMGDKINARKEARDSDVKVIPGSYDVLHDAQDAIDAARVITQEHGYPLMMKAVAGGGGRGIALVQSENEVAKEFERLSAEALKLFGNRGLYLEKAIHGKRHIEVQILGDQYGHVIHLGERDCSVQRNNQKLIEFSPANLHNRNQLYDSAVRLGMHMGYATAGTVEYLVDQQGNHYFMEMNTRIQVEHRVTELVSGIDLIVEQIKAAAGEKLSYSQNDVHFNGFAVECRVNAEDPDNNFTAMPGLIMRFLPPQGEGIVVDTFVPRMSEGGFQISPNYDSLLANVITHGRDRQEAFQRMKDALSGFEIDGKGVRTTIPYHLAKLDDMLRNSL